MNQSAPPSGDLLEHPIGLCLAGLAVGVAAIRHDPVLGCKRLALPISYWRTAEFAYAARQLRLPRGAAVLDLGSPKDFSAHLARYRGFAVTATDIIHEAIDLSSRLARHQGLEGIGPGKVHSEIQDGRSLTYADDSFDAAVSISVLEHIPDDGDAGAIAELVRCVRPGGRIVVTTPYAKEYSETFLDRPVYDRAQADNRPVFYERHYDAVALERRLLQVPGARLVDIALWGEGPLQLDSWMKRHSRVRMFLSPVEWLLSAANLKELGKVKMADPRAAFFTLEVV